MFYSPRLEMILDASIIQYTHLLVLPVPRNYILRHQSQTKLRTLVPDFGIENAEIISDTTSIPYKSGFHMSAKSQMIDRDFVVSRPSQMFPILDKSVGDIGDDIIRTPEKVLDSL